MHAQSSNQASIKFAILAALVALSEKSQRAIARDAGMSPSHLNRLLSRSHTPTDRTFWKIVHATGAPPTTVGLALIVGADNLPLVAQSDFMAHLIAELPTQLLQRLGADLIKADPRWAKGIIEYVVSKTEETVARKRKAETDIELNL